ncbi:CAP domain-containing protein [Streptomyces sp. MH13]|uniref:CAP domain-containing protein n=1 Tax=Streptomyces sp. MH13 TaxID=3417651 RepID=UPI003CF48794
MGSRRAARPSRSHARPRGGLRTRGAALVLGAVTVTAGVGITLAVAEGEDGKASDRVATNAAGEAPGAEAPAGGATPSASASASPIATASSPPSGSAEPKDEKEPKTSASPATSPVKAAAPASRAPARTTAKSGGDRAADGSGSGSGTGTGSASEPGPGSGGVGGSEARVLALVNEERAAAGCSPVTANSRLTRAADDYSDVMASSGVMSHTGPDGSTMASRVEAAGYQWSTLGENIARGQADAASVMDSWMNSPGHRANILNCSFKELGVGVHFGDGGPWWTQNFGTSR